MHVSLRKSVAALCLTVLAVAGGASAETDSRDAMKSGASTTLGASIAAFDSVLGQAMSGYGHVRLTGGGLFLATRARGHMPRFWSALQVREYHGGTEGLSSSLLTGYERALGQDARIGFSMAFSRADLDTGRGIESATTSFGPYLKTSIGEESWLKTWAVLARPQYTLGGHSHIATRFGGGLRAGTEHHFGWLKLSGSASLSASRQVHPDFTAPEGHVEGFEIDKLNTAFGSRATLDTESRFKPYLDLGLSWGRWRSDEAQGDFSTPSLAAGLNWRREKRSFLLNVDAGQVFDPARPLTLRTQYRLSF